MDILQSVSQSVGSIPSEIDRSCGSGTNCQALLLDCAKSQCESQRKPLERVWEWCLLALDVSMAELSRLLEVWCGFHSALRWA